MSIRLRWLITVGVVVFASIVPRHLDAQLENLAYSFKYNSGQTIQPIFDGWSRNSDGSVTMHFGYLNRNFVEEPYVPLGPDNNIEPGGPDQGQPTYFYTRTNRKAFSVRVPKDWGKKELVWSITVHGKTEKAVAWLQPEWEIDSSDARTSGEGSKNQPPTLSVAAPATINVSNPLILTATVTDDGLPNQARPQRNPAVGQETPPILQPGAGSTDAVPVNVPQARTNPRGIRVSEQPPRGLSVAYFVWRGPANVNFTPRFSEVKDGKAITNATFTKPGEYILRARATDTALSTLQDIKVIVK
jgi:hypothetical protein